MSNNLTERLIIIIYRVRENGKHLTSPRSAFNFVDKLNIIMFSTNKHDVREKDIPSLVTKILAHILGKIDDLFLFYSNEWKHRIPIL